MRNPLSLVCIKRTYMISFISCENRTHTRKLGRHRDEGPSSFFLDGPQAQRTVRPHPRQDDTNSAVLLVIRQRAKEEVNRQMRTAVARGRFVFGRRPFAFFSTCVNRASYPLVFL